MSALRTFVTISPTLKLSYEGPSDTIGTEVLFKNLSDSAGTLTFSRADTFGVPDLPMQPGGASLLPVVGPTPCRCSGWSGVLKSAPDSITIPY